MGRGLVFELHIFLEFKVLGLYKGVLKLNILLQYPQDCLGYEGFDGS